MELLLLFLQIVLAHEYYNYNIPKKDSSQCEDIGMPYAKYNILRDLYTNNSNKKSQDVDLNNRYWLFTRKNPKKYQLLVDGNKDSIKRSNYRPNLPLIVITHGWKGNGSQSWIGDITSAVLQEMNANVIVLDWREAADKIYAKAVHLVPAVGKQLGNFLMRLIGQFGGKWEKVHLVGHSLGAHVVGAAGRITGGLPGRISGPEDQAGRTELGRQRFEPLDFESDQMEQAGTVVLLPISVSSTPCGPYLRFVELKAVGWQVLLGLVEHTKLLRSLDPAGPLWKVNRNALSRDSGVYVESIHTDGGLKGLMAPISHVDFYVNGGHNPQPGCTNSSCSHARSTELFTASILSNNLVGHKCKNLVQATLNRCKGDIKPMGNINPYKEGTGIYGLTTESTKPFATKSEQHKILIYHI